MSEVRLKVETHLVASVGCTPHQHPSITIHGSVSLLDDVHPRAAPSVGSCEKPPNHQSLMPVVLPLREGNVNLCCDKDDLLFSVLQGWEPVGGVK